MAVAGSRSDEAFSQRSEPGVTPGARSINSEIRWSVGDSAIVRSGRRGEILQIFSGEINGKAVAVLQLDGERGRYAELLSNLRG